jgi:hypothetical protein
MPFPNDQGNPAGAIPVWNAGSNFLNIPTNVYTQVKTGPGVLSGLSVNTAGTTSSATVYDGTSSVVTITIATPGVISWPAHGLIAGSAVQFQSTGALPTGLTAGTTYYVSTVGLTAAAFSVADTQAHALAGTNTIATSGSQSGVQTAYDVSHPIGTFSTLAQGNIPIGAQFQNGLIVVTAGGAAANVTALYR